MPSDFLMKSLMMALPLYLELAGLLIVIVLDPYIRREHRRIMFVNVLLIATLIVQNQLNDYHSIYGSTNLAMTLTSIYGYAVPPVVLLLFCHIVGRKEHFLPFWILAGVNAAVNLTALVSPVCFRFNELGHFERGPLGFTSHGCCLVILAWLLLLTLRMGRTRSWRQIIIPVLNAAAVVAGVVLDTFILETNRGVTFTTLATVTSCLFYGIWLHLRFVEEHREAFMAEQRIRIMMSQIQPHFLFNTLSSIQALCLSDPEKAFEVTERFGTYLRQNIDSLNEPQLIPFEKELEHTRIYAEIEMIRFPSVRVEYDTPDTDFLLPALTVQPLVENAIRHGVRGREDGLVQVASALRGGCHEIVIRDNGVGFDPEGAEDLPAGHIGIRNVRERIEGMCGGTVTVRSVPGAGTTVTIRVPITE